jgi:FkbH-like protein
MSGAPSTAHSTAAGLLRLKEMLALRDPAFWPLLREETRRAAGCNEVLRLSTLRKKARQGGWTPGHPKIRVAILGGYTFHPLSDLVAHFLDTGPESASFEAEFLLGDYDNAAAEIIENAGRLYEFQPEIIFLFPSHRLCRYSGHLPDDRTRQEAEGRDVARQILELCGTANRRCGAEVILANFLLPGRFDPGPYRARTLGSDYSFRKFVNLELGLNAPGYVHICDAEFLSARRGTLEAWDDRAWFESKQPYGSGLLLDVAREAAHLVASLRQSPKKVAVVDLDNTLWGGVIGDDGLAGIEIGDTSPRGEAFKSFQQYLLSLTKRGVLLAVCSKNDRDKAVEAFEKHPEMVLRMKDFSAFQANWQPKPDNIRQIAAELNLGLDSMVFLDDNPAEIDIVRQFVPEVETILLGDDPAEYRARVEDARCFEPRSLTAEDIERVGQYRREAQRRESLSSATDMDAYLGSLGMEAAIREFRSEDIPRIAQLINKSNQFNLTTRRRTEAELLALMDDPGYFGLTVRLADRFGDYGLISVVIGAVNRQEMEIDTWVMSCRVLKREVEDEVFNEIVRLAKLWDCRRICGLYLPTAKNGMVRDHYPALGFAAGEPRGKGLAFELDPRLCPGKPTKIRIAERCYDPK